MSPHTRKIVVCLCLLLFQIQTHSQTVLSPGDLAFTAFNLDGDQDFAVVVLNDIPANSIIYFTDSEPDADGDGILDFAPPATDNEGMLKWETGGIVITAGTIVVFNDVTDNMSISATIGTISLFLGNFDLEEDGDNIYACTANIEETALTGWVAGIQNAAGQEGVNFSQTGLTLGTTYVEFYTSGSPDGGYYNGSRTNKSAFNVYPTSIGDNSLWVTDDTNGENILPISTTSFQEDWKGKAGDIAFVAYNADGDDDFAIVALKNIIPNTEIYFTNTHPRVGGDGVTGSGGIVQWITGDNILTAGTVVVFSDMASDMNRSVSDGGTLIESDIQGFNFDLDPAGDALYAFLVNDSLTAITEWLAGIQNAAGQEGANFGDTGLTMGTTFVEFYSSGDPNGGSFTGARSGKDNFSEYLTDIGNSANWSVEDTDGENILPISTDVFSLTGVSWLGGYDSDWSNTLNWSGGAVPTLLNSVVIPASANDLVITGTGLADDLTVESGASLTVNSNAVLIVISDITNSGSITLESDASIIAKNSSASINMKRAVTSGWHLISCPLNQVIISDFVDKDVDINAIATNGNNYGLATYDNNGTSWNYYNTSNLMSAGLFLISKGYAALRTSAGEYTFSGDMDPSDASIEITQGTTNNWNLIGNPFTTYIPANETASLTQNILAHNSAVIDPAFLAIYFWDSNSSSYQAANQVSSPQFIAPGQGFFVHSINGGGTFSFTKDMQSHPPENKDFKNNTSNSRPEIKLTVFDQDNRSFETEIYYISGATTGLDPGYDAGLFDSGSNLSLYSHLVSDSDGVDFMLQCLPDENYEDMVIPVGIESSESTELTFKATFDNFPDGISLYLEDTVLNTWTNLSKIDDQYTITLDGDLTGIGRFYLHTRSSPLSTVESINENISIYTTDNKNLNIIGLFNTHRSVVKIYNILGQELLNTSFVPKNVNQFSLAKLRPGIYVVSLTTASGEYQQKVVIE